MFARHFRLVKRRKNAMEAFEATPQPAPVAPDSRQQANWLIILAVMPQEITGMQHALAIDREEIVQIYKLIRPHVRRTPVIEVDGADFGLAGISIVLKLELLQYSGSFKARGAMANLLVRNVPPAGVVAASGGNHGAAVAFAAHRLGKPARIFVPKVASASKIERIRGSGAELLITGDRYAAALAASQEWAARSGRWKCTLTIRSRRCSAREL